MNITSDDIKKELERINAGTPIELYICRYCRECGQGAKNKNVFGCIQHCKKVRLNESCDRFYFIGDVGKKYVLERIEWSD